MLFSYILFVKRSFRAYSYFRKLR